MPTFAEKTRKRCRNTYPTPIFCSRTATPDWRSSPSREDIPAGSVAYHPIFGEVVYGYHWYLPSTMELCDNLKAAEANPAIVAHVLHIDSPGGEAFGLHEAFELIRSLHKPVYAVVESCCCSAAYYLAADGCSAGTGNNVKMMLPGIPDQFLHVLHR